MNLLICIDDTDNYDSPGTGEILENLGINIEAKGWGVAGFITRHQLLIHKEIRYTSHNSSMCFLVKLDTGMNGYDRLIKYAAEYLTLNCAQGSDPGLCIVDLDKVTKEEVEKLIDFGQKAKQIVLCKEKAYSLAEELGSVYLSEHGGTGDGIIGAIAGCGLRLSGNDGRIKGKMKVEVPGEIMSAKEVKERYQVQAVKVIPAGKEIGDAELILLGNEVKAVYRGFQTTIPVCGNDDKASLAKWRICDKKQLKDF